MSEERNCELLKKIQISICIPVYNAKPYLNDLLGSITFQNLRNISYEIIFIDDCSTDGSFEHLCEITKELKNVRILKNEKNSGISYTRNRLLDNAQGEYIWFVDSDDMLYPGAIEALLNIAKSTNADVILGNYIKVEENSGVLTDSTAENIDYKEVNFENLDWLPDKNNNCRMLSMCRGIFKKNFFDKNNLRFNEKVVMKEDALLYYAIGMLNPKTIKSEFLCYCVRQRTSSAMHGINAQKAERHFYSALALVEEYQQHIVNENYRDINILTKLIEEEKEVLVKYLLYIPNTKFVKEQLKVLESKGLYPYKMKIKKISNIRQVIDLLLPTHAGFWFYYLLRTTIYKNLKS